MRLTSFQNCLSVLNYYSVDYKNKKTIDVGGTENVYLKPRFGYHKNPVRKNPILDEVPGIVMLDKGYNIEQLSTHTDHQIDFLDTKSVEPLKGQFDVVFCFDTLEHTPDPITFCDNLLYIVKPGGYVYISTLFKFVYHPSPGDYFRYTPEGLEACFKNPYSKFSSESKVVWSGWEGDDIGVGILVQRSPFTNENSRPKLKLRPEVKKSFVNRTFDKVRDVLEKIEVKLTSDAQRR